MNRKIAISKYSDFCFGVKRAISLAEEALKDCPKPALSLGPLIHNQQVVEKLSQRGLNVAEDLGRIKEGTVVIRSHGIDPGILGQLRKRNIRIVDATCPFVKNAQGLARKLSKEGYKIIIVGDRRHPEVESLLNFSGDDSNVIVNKDDARRLNLKKGKIGVIAQTTQSLKNLQDIMFELLKKDFGEIRIFNTICSDADMRQRATEELSRDNDVVFVIGGRNSANTKRLYEICKRRGTRAYHIETGSEIKREWLKGRHAIGIVSGASTPRWIVDEVVVKLKTLNNA